MAYCAFRCPEEALQAVGRGGNARVIETVEQVLLISVEANDEAVYEVRCWGVDTIASQVERQSVEVARYSCGCFSSIPRSIQAIWCTRQFMSKSSQDVRVAFDSVGKREFFLAWRECVVQGCQQGPARVLPLRRFFFLASCTSPRTCSNR